MNRGPAPAEATIRDDDRELARRVARRGDGKAFRALYDSHTPRLLRFVMRLNAGHADAYAEDIVQEVWIRALKKLSRFRWESSLATWLQGIALNVSRERWRRRNPTDAGIEVQRRPAELAAPSAGSHEDRIDLERALALLPERRRTVVVLHDLYGFTHADVARLLDIAEGTSKSHLHDARTQLESILVEGALHG